MALVTDKVKEKAAKCMECLEKRKKMRDFLVFKRTLAGKGVFDKETAQAIYTGAKFVVDNMVKLSCSFCMRKEEFTKVYGMTPAEYLTRDLTGNKAG